MSTTEISISSLSSKEESKIQIAITCNTINEEKARKSASQILAYLTPVNLLMIQINFTDLYYFRNLLLHMYEPDKMRRHVYNEKEKRIVDEMSTDYIHKMQEELDRIVVEQLKHKHLNNINLKKYFCNFICAMGREEILCNKNTDKSILMKNKVSEPSTFRQNLSSLYFELTPDHYINSFKAYSRLLHTNPIQELSHLMTDYFRSEEIQIVLIDKNKKLKLS